MHLFWKLVGLSDCVHFLKQLEFLHLRGFFVQVNLLHPVHYSLLGSLISRLLITVDEEVSEALLVGFAGEEGLTFKHLFQHSFYVLEGLDVQTQLIVAVVDVQQGDQQFLGLIHRQLQFLHLLPHVFVVLGKLVLLQRIFEVGEVTTRPFHNIDAGVLGFEYVFDGLQHLFSGNRHHLRLAVVIRLGFLFLGFTPLFLSCLFFLILLIFFLFLYLLLFRRNYRFEFEV